MNSIIVYMPVFNEGRFLSVAIESVLAQSHDNFHLLISNNFSTDNSLSIIEKYLNDKRVLLIKPPNHLTSLEHVDWIDTYIEDHFSSGHFNIFIGGHDIWSKDYLMTLLLGMVENPNAAVVYTDSYEIDENDKITKKHNGYIATAEIIKPLKPLHVLVGTSHNIIIGGLWRSSIKSKIKPLYKCMGIDHFLIAEASLLGDLVYKFGGQIGLRSVDGAGDWGIYIRKHLGFYNIIPDDGISDFKNQLAWAISLQERAVENTGFYENPLILNSLIIAMVNGYTNRYWAHLNAFGAIQSYLNIESIKNSNILISNVVREYKNFSSGGML